MKWEYTIVNHEIDRRNAESGVPIAESEKGELNDYGADGWELVAVLPAENDGVLASVTYYFKRKREMATA